MTGTMPAAIAGRPQQHDARVADADLVAVADLVLGRDRGERLTKVPLREPRIDDVRALSAHDEARMSARDSAAHELEIGVGAAPEVDGARDRQLDGERVRADHDRRAERLDVAERRRDVMLGDHRMVAPCHDEKSTRTMPTIGARR